MAAIRLPSPRVTAVAAIASLALASAMIVSDSGPNQAAHFALVRALASGTAQIDPGETIDAAHIDGHYYAAKAPGLAIFALPWYGALRAVGLQGQALATESGYRDRVWELTLFGSLLPFVALLLLMFAVVERVVPGYGLPTSVLLGAGTLLLPFSTLFFDHVLSATLGFAAFTILLLERDGVGGAWLLAAGGLLAGFAVAVEFPLAVVVLVLGVYAVAGVASGWSGAAPRTPSVRSPACSLSSRTTHGPSARRQRSATPTHSSGPSERTRLSSARTLKGSTALACPIPGWRSRCSCRKRDCSS